jgi:hypothetical protein
VNHGLHEVKNFLTTTAQTAKKGGFVSSPVPLHPSCFTYHNEENAGIDSKPKPRIRRLRRRG